MQISTVDIPLVLGLNDLDLQGQIELQNQILPNFELVVFSVLNFQPQNAEISLPPIILPSV